MTLIEEIESYCEMKDRRYKLKPTPRTLTTGPVPIRMLKAAAKALRRYERDTAKMYAALEFYAEPERVGGHWNEDYPGGVSWQCGERVCLDMGEHAKYALKAVTANTKRMMKHEQEHPDGRGESDAGGAVGE